MPLTTLRIRDLATIAEVSLELTGGLNVLTGETGAGKSMLVDALALLIGDRADRAVVRPGAARAVIEGVVEQPPAAAMALLDEAGIDADEPLILRREVTAEGRSRGWVNGSPVTIGMLATLGEHLVDLHGQHQTRQLIEPATQRNLLDAHAGAMTARTAVRAAWQQLVSETEASEALSRRRDEVRQRADWLRHLVEEVDAARIQPGEEEELARESHRLSQAGSLAEQARRIVAAIDQEHDGARNALSRLERALGALERNDPDAVAGWRELQDSAYAQLDELALRATQYADGLAEDPDRLARLEQRRDRLGRLTRKHGVDAAGLLALRDSAQAELDLMDRAAFDLQAMAARVEVARSTLAAHAATLTALRQQGAIELAREVSQLLPSLGLTGGALTVHLEPVDPPTGDGAEQVQLLVQLNRGMEPRPLARVASGGELSRLMLALKVVLARHDLTPTLVFDEVDQGIGGEIGGQVGSALAAVATQHQVLVITHLPQIAACADHHLRVAKSQAQGIATSDVATLRGEDRIDELARMLGDADGDAARLLAQSLLGQARP